MRKVRRSTVPAHLSMARSWHLRSELSSLQSFPFQARLRDRYRYLGIRLSRLEFALFDEVSPTESRFSRSPNISHLTVALLNSVPKVVVYFLIKLLGQLLVSRRHKIVRPGDRTELLVFDVTKKLIPQKVVIRDALHSWLFAETRLRFTVRFRRLQDY